MTREFTEIRKAVFKLHYRCSYSSIDIEISNSCRTTATSAQLKPYPDLHDLIEIDQSKAYTDAFKRINKVPVFNEVDIHRR